MSKATTLQRWIARVVWFVVLGSACVQDPIEPMVRSVEPELIFNGEAVDVAIQGSHFYPKILANVSDPSASRLLDDFRVDLFVREDPDNPLDAELPRELTLSSVRFESLQRLVATVPEGLEPATYDIRVTTPLGLTDDLEQALTVVDGSAAALEIELSEVSYKVYEQASMGIRLIDRLGEPVQQNWPVRLILKRDDGQDVPVAFEPGGLENQQRVNNGITGDLGADGYAEVAFSVAEPVSVSVQVSGDDELERLQSDDVRLQWLPGDNIQVLVERLAPDEPVVAGEPFLVRLTYVDEWGNPLLDLNDAVVVEDACTSWAGVYQIAGSAQVEVLTRRVTGTDTCDEGRIVVSNSSAVSTVLGESAPFEVLAGPVRRFDVDNIPLLVTAGQEFTAFITAEDAYGNAADWDGALDLPTDTVDGVVGASCEGVGGTRTCSVRVIRAGSAILATFTGDPDLSGVTRPYRVVPADPARVQVAPVNSSWVAGEAVEVEVWLEDEFGNEVDASLLEPERMSWSSTVGPVPCTWSGLTDGRHHFACALEQAQASIAITVTHGDDLEPALIDGLSVINGPLAALEVVPFERTIAAGEPVQVSVTGVDSYGNPYVVQEDADLTLTAVAGGLVSPDVITLGADGRASEAVRLFKAGTTALRVESSLGVSGLSESITVEPGEGESLAVELDTPWVWVFTDNTVRVEVLDAYGNRATEDATVQLSSTNAIGAAIVVPVVNGTGTGLFQWDSAATSDRLVATSETLGTGASDSIIVVQDCGQTSPVLQVAPVGQARPTYCLRASTGLADVQLTMASSIARQGTLAAYGISIDGVGGISGVSPVMSLAVGDVGRHDVTAMVVQNNGCGTEEVIGVDVGLPGKPAGEVTLEPLLDTLSLASGTPVTEVSVAAVLDCDGAPASGETLQVRTDLGEVIGALQTGEGLSVTLDSSGESAFFLDASAVSTGGAAGVSVWTRDGAARGTTTVVLEGDLLPPEVWSQEPKGRIESATDRVTIQFSEPMDSGSFGSGGVSLTGTPSLDLVGVVLSEDGYAADLLLNRTISPEDVGSWQVVLSTDVRDEAGNGIDGTWSGGRDAYLGPFGVGVMVEDILSCSLDVSRFRPDGDSGSGIHVEDVAFSFVSGAAPAWWVVSVRDASGLVIRHDYMVPLGASDSWRWDGRDEAGRVQPSGLYTLEVVAEGNQGNRGGGCLRTVEIDLETL